jgi:hypothetical protein
MRTDRLAPDDRAQTLLSRHAGRKAESDLEHAARNRDAPDARARSPNPPGKC